MIPDLAADQAVERIMVELTPPTCYRGQRVGGDWLVWQGPDRLFPWMSQQVRNHSPAGFAWGYGGSGPAQLALAILINTGLHKDVASGLYQQFKWDHVAHWPQEGEWQLDATELLEWIETRLVVERQRQLEDNYERGTDEG